MTRVELKLSWGRDGAPVLIQIRPLGARRRGKGSRTGLGITPYLLPFFRQQCTPEPLEGDGFWPGGSISLQKPRSRLGAGPACLGNFKEETNPKHYLKRTFPAEAACWRGERALCCNRGEGRALTQPSTAGEAALGHQALTRLLHPPGTHGRGRAGKQGQRLGRGEGWR